ncbi:MAG: hypothetical protein R3B54_07315 [Bdellovibrionota bacterium]
MSGSTLLEAAFEGSDDFSVRTEFLYSSTSSRLHRSPLQKFGSGSTQCRLPGSGGSFNFFLTGIQSLESSIAVGLIRAEWLVTSHNTFGTSFLLSPTNDVIWSAD